MFHDARTSESLSDIMSLDSLTTIKYIYKQYNIIKYIIKSYQISFSPGWWNDRRSMKVVKTSCIYAIWMNYDELSIP